MNKCRITTTTPWASKMKYPIRPIWPKQDKSILLNNLGCAPRYHRRYLLPVSLYGLIWVKSSRNLIINHGKLLARVASARYGVYLLTVHHLPEDNNEQARNIDLNQVITNLAFEYELGFDAGVISRCILLKMGFFTALFPSFRHN